MSKSKKKGPEEEPFKLNLSFEEAIRLALKTPPTMSMKLILNEEQELKDENGKIDYAGRIIQFKQMTMEPNTENVHGFYIEIKRTGGDTEHIIPFVHPNGNGYSAYFNSSPNGPFPIIQIGNSEKVFLILRKALPDLESNVSYCIVTFSLATRVGHQ